MKKKTLFGDILQSVSRYFLILVILVAVGIACSGIRIVESGNVALILRFGKLVGDTPEEQIHEPGLLLAFPYIIDEVVIVPTGSVMEHVVTTYYTAEDMRTRDGAYVITGDQNVAVLSASVKYTVSDPVEYALNVSDVKSVINACVSNAMLAEAVCSDVDDILTKGKDRFCNNALRQASEKMESCGVGVSLTTLELTYVSMPKEVRETYDKVNSATVQAETLLENARVYREKLIPSANSLAQGNIAQANNDYAAATSAATEALSEFWGVLEEYEANPRMVMTRLLAEKTQAIVQKIGTVRVVREGESTILLIPKAQEEEPEVEYYGEH